MKKKSTFLLTMLFAIVCCISINAVPTISSILSDYYNQEVTSIEKKQLKAPAGYDSSKGIAKPAMGASLPGGVTVNYWYMNGTTYDDSPVTNRVVQVAFEGNDIYLCGIFTNFPDVWVKGTINGSTITFEPQYLGYAYDYSIYLMGCDNENIVNLTATYNELSGQIVFNNNIIANADQERIFYLEYYQGVTIKAPQVKTYENWASSNHDDGSTDSKEWSVVTDVPDAILAFDFTVDSERGCDNLIVTLNGAEILRQSGQVSGGTSTGLSTPGTYRIVARYEKDGSVSHGEDMATITNLRIIQPSTGVTHEDIASLLNTYESYNQTPLTTEYAACSEYASTLKALDDKIVAGESVDQEDLDTAFMNLENALTEFKNAVESYNKLIEEVVAYTEYYKLNISNEFSAAYVAAQSVIANIATQTSAAIISAEQTFSQAYESFVANNQQTKVWDFAFSEETIAKLQYDASNWGCWNNYGNYYRLACSGDWSQLSCYDGSESGERAVIPETEGIYFYNGGCYWTLYVDGTNRIYSYSSGTSYQFKIPNLTEGQIITINYTTGSNGNTRGITRYSDNTQVISGQERTTSTAEVQYEVISDGDVYFYPYNGAIYINSISVTVPGDPLRLAEVRKEVAEYITTLDEFPGLKSELQEAYDNAVITDDDTDVESLIVSLENVMNDVKKAIEVYPSILEDIETANAVLTEGAYVDISEAVALGSAIDVNASRSAEYIAAFEALETSLAIYNADKVDMSDWAFNTDQVYVADGLRYYIDTTNNLAEFIGFNTNNTYSGTLNIPTAIRVDGTRYCVVAMINNGRYTQSNITNVILPKSLRQIGDYGLGYLSNVHSIEIPENVTSMGSNVFYNSNELTSIRINAVVPPTITSMSGSSYKKITIPAESFHAYRLASGWGSNILIGGDGVTVSTGKIVAGDLGHIVLDEATYLQEVNKLIIDEGTLNNDDWNTIKSMTNLIEVDMSGVTMSSLPANAFDGRWAIEKVILPQNTTTIGNYAFRGTGIKEINLPESLITLGTYSFRNCDSLSAVVIPSAISVIPDYCFEDCDRLQRIDLPEGLTTVKRYALNSCNSLSEVSLPSTITTIGNYAFRYCPIKEIEIPAGVKTINDYAFANNAAVDSLVIPETVVSINECAFADCSSLRNVQFNEGLTNLYYCAFSNCRNLTEITLPSSLERCQDAPFYGCTGVKKIEARSVIPPTTGGSCPLSNVSLNDIVLTVPSWSTSEYPLADGWSSFYTVETSDFMPQNIKVNKDFYFTVKEEFAPDYRPNIYMTYSDVQSTDAYGYTNYERGNLTISGRSKLAANNFDFVVSPFAKYYADENIRYNYTYDYYRTNLNSTSLIVNGEMRAEDVCLQLNNYNSRWQFVTFPFDVKVSDIVPQNENISWVIRGHNSAMRAAGKVDSVWVNLTADDILEAGKGYIMHNYNPDYTNSWFNVTPIKESVNRQLIFSSEDRTIQLEENLGEFDHNRSWNLIGNPYPCFYDSRFMDFDAPFMVWNSYNQNYVAYNPADDAYILSPGEAFFVQRPFEQESITFRKEGRQTHRYAREMEINAPARINPASGVSRYVYNVVLSQDSMMDRTRVVFNDEASVGYEMSRDAAKFASTERSVPQIFTIVDNTRYAINERPYATGDVVLGVHCGTDGEYTIALDKNYNCTVILEDKVTNEFVELSKDDVYTFSAFAGDYLDRFVLHFQNEATGIENVDAANDSNDAIYNLQGMKVNNTNANGIYIKNGKKTMVK